LTGYQLPTDDPICHWQLLILDTVNGYANIGRIIPLLIVNG